MYISLIVAASSNDAIGRKGELLWNLPNDTKFFKNTTWAMPVVMGRKTYESLGKPLPGRTNVVITKQSDWKADDAVVSDNLEHALEEAMKIATNEIFIIGGGQIYKEAMPIANRIYITRVDMIATDADAFFPPIDTNEWVLVSKKDFEKDEKHAYNYSFQTWERKQS